jgi:hypothetical protein
MSFAGGYIQELRDIRSLPKYRQKFEAAVASLRQCSERGDLITKLPGDTVVYLAAYLRPDLFVSRSYFKDKEKLSVAKPDICIEPEDNQRHYDIAIGCALRLMQLGLLVAEREHIPLFSRGLLYEEFDKASKPPLDLEEFKSNPSDALRKWEERVLSWETDSIAPDFNRRDNKTSWEYYPNPRFGWHVKAVNADLINAVGGKLRKKASALLRERNPKVAQVRGHVWPKREVMVVFKMLLNFIKGDEGKRNFLLGLLYKHRVRFELVREEARAAMGNDWQRMPIEERRARLETHCALMDSKNDDKFLSQPPEKIKADIAAAMTKSGLPRIENWEPYKGWLKREGRIFDAVRSAWGVQLVPDILPSFGEFEGKLLSKS